MFLDTCTCPNQFGFKNGHSTEYYSNAHLCTKRNE